MCKNNTSRGGEQASFLHKQHLLPWVHLLRMAACATERCFPAVWDTMHIKHRV